MKVFCAAVKYIYIGGSAYRKQTDVLVLPMTQVSPDDLWHELVLVG